MRIKDEIYRIELTNFQVQQLIEYLMEARNRFLQQGKPTEDVNCLLMSVIKLQKRHKVRVKCNG